MTHGGNMFGLTVRFSCKDDDSARRFDELVARTLPEIRRLEPGTLIYAVHRVDGQPLQRVFYELYRDRSAFEAHEEQPHTRRFLTEREQYLAGKEVDFLTLQDAKGTGGLGERAHIPGGARPPDRRAPTSARVVSA